MTTLILYSFYFHIGSRHITVTVPWRLVRRSRHASPGADACLNAAIRQALGRQPKSDDWLTIADFGGAAK